MTENQSRLITIEGSGVISDTGLKWNSPKHHELPSRGEIVWVLMQHWKEHNPLSCEMFCGEVEWSNDKKICRINTAHFTGGGSTAYVIWRAEDYEFRDEAPCVAWIYAKDFILPSWVPHNKHWD